MLSKWLKYRWMKINRRLRDYLDGLLGVSTRFDVQGERIRELKREVEYLRGLYKNLVSIGVDVHFKEPHMIIVYSNIAGGQIRHIPVHFRNISELNDFCRRLRETYNTDKITYDVPHGFPRKVFDQ